MNRTMLNCGAAHQTNLSVRERILSAFHSRPSTSGRCNNVGLPTTARPQRRQDCLHCCAASKSKGGRSSGVQGFKGFGDVPKPSQKSQRALTFDPDSSDENEAAAANDDDAEEEIQLKPAYRMYTDKGYKAQRFVGPLTLRRSEEHPHPVLSATANVLPGELLLVSPALGWAEGGFQEIPELEDLHASILEDGPSPVQRRILNVLDSLRPAPPPPSQPSSTSQPTSQQEPVPSIATLDPKFWTGRARDTSTPEISSRRLMNLLSRTAISGESQDPASSQARHQKPLGYVALFPEAALLGHSCVPNTSQLIVDDRLLMHATKELEPGMPLTRNLIGEAITAPLSQRQAALEDVMKEMAVERLLSRPARRVTAVNGTSGDGASQVANGDEEEEDLLRACRCPRCTLEASVSVELRDTLESAYNWYINEAQEAWAVANRNEDETILRGLLSDCATLLEEVEEAIQAEPGLSEDQQEWLRASAYEVYDMLVTVDELLNQDTADPGYLRICLDLIRVHSPGSESHVMVACKHESIRNSQLDVYGEMLKREKPSGGRRPAGLSKRERQKLQALADAAEHAAEYRVEAIIMRYGLVTEEVCKTLTEGMATYMDGLEQMAAMQAAGVDEVSREMELDGVKVQIVDKLEVSQESRSGGPGTRVVGQDGMQVTVVEGRASDEVQRGVVGRRVVEEREEEAVGVEEEREGADGWYEIGDVEGEGEEVDLVDVLEGRVEMDESMRAALDEALQVDIADIEADLE